MAPQPFVAAIEKQMRAERAKRVVILHSEGTRDAAIGTAKGEKQQVLKASEACKQQQINEALGQAEAILSVATATAEGIRRMAARPVRCIAVCWPIERPRFRVAGGSAAAAPRLGDPESQPPA